MSTLDSVTLLQTAAGWVWENSFYASVLIIMVWLLRKLPVRWAPVFVCYWLGLLVLARLLLPVAPSSAWSIYNLSPSSNIQTVCDEMVLRRVAGEERQAYGRILIKLLEDFQRTQFSGVVISAINNKTEMKRRIVMIAKFKPRRWVGLTFGTLLAGVVCLTTFTRAIEELVEGNPAESLMFTGRLEQVFEGANSGQNF
jgi:beta-lactamase regulating signal transducer with metallopeptidase domain